MTVMRKLVTTAAQLGLAIIPLAFSGIAQCEENPFSKWAAAQAVPIATVEPGKDVQDLLPLTSVVGTADVVALGEPMHGAHEPMAFRNRLFRFLVEQMGFTAIAVETGFSESSSVNWFVSGAQGEAQSHLRTALGRHAENYELIHWMRDHNGAAAAAGHHGIRFYGIDLTNGGGAGGPRRVIDYALVYLSRADPREADRIRLSLGDSLPPSDDRTFGMLPQNALQELDDTLPKIATAMAKNRSDLIAHSSVDAYRWALHNIEVGRQLAKCFHVTTPKSFQDIRYSTPVMNCRDRAMADNVAWIATNEGSKGRVLVFAHDGHIMNWKEDGPRMAQVPDKPFMMGFHLRRALGKRLVIIAMSSATTSPGLPTPHPAEDGIDEALARVGLPRMLLDLRLARQDPAALAWLSRPHLLFGETNALITPLIAVDAFVFVDRLTPAIGSPDEAH